MTIDEIGRIIFTYGITLDRLEEICNAERDGRLVEVSVLEKAYTVANNAIYFCDGSDYGTALYEICRILKPSTIEIGRKYIEQRIVEND